MQSGKTASHLNQAFFFTLFFLYALFLGPQLHGGTDTNHSAKTFRPTCNWAYVQTQTNDWLIPDAFQAFALTVLRKLLLQLAR